jgi:hypothetical protein
MKHQILNEDLVTRIHLCTYVPYIYIYIYTVYMVYIITDLLCGLNYIQ